MRNIEKWAIANNLPYGDLPPFGRDGVRPPMAYSEDLLPHLYQFNAAARLHPAYEGLRIGQYELFRPAKSKAGTAPGQQHSASLRKLPNPPG